MNINIIFLLSKHIKPSGNVTYLRGSVDGIPDYLGPNLVVSMWRYPDHGSAT